MQTKYKSIYGEDGISQEQIQYIESKLAVILPPDFKCIAGFFNGGDLCSIDNYAFYNNINNYNIVDETLLLRNSINLPKKFIVLAEPPESIIVMDTLCKPSIIWCDSYDVENLSNIQLLNNPCLWDSYADFFWDMLEDLVD